MIEELMKLLYEAETTAPQCPVANRLEYMAQYLLDNGVTVDIQSNE